MRLHGFKLGVHTMARQPLLKESGSALGYQRPRLQPRPPEPHAGSHMPAYAAALLVGDV